MAKPSTGIMAVTVALNDAENSRFRSSTAFNAIHPLFRIPPELRNHIYNLVLPNDAPGQLLVYLPKQRHHLPTKLPLVCHHFYRETDALYQAAKRKYFHTHRLVIDLDSSLFDASSNAFFLRLFKQFEREKVLVRNLTLAFSIDNCRDIQHTEAVTLSAGQDEGEDPILAVQDDIAVKLQGSSQGPNIYFPSAVAELQHVGSVFVTPVPEVGPRIDVAACVKILCSAFEMGGKDSLREPVRPMGWKEGRM